MTGKKGYIILSAGLLCIIAALALFLFNTVQAQHARTVSEQVVSALSEQIEQAANESAEAFPTDNPDRIMPQLTVDNQGYIGILRIPALDLELPVLAQFDEDALQITPCLYSGSAYQGNMVIGAHNYDAHFGRIASLGVGDEVSFTDAENHLYRYQVVDFETLRPEQRDDLIQKKSGSDWALSLFTCNYTGSARVVVRCSAERK